MPDLSDTVAKCRMGTAKKFYTSIASLSHTSKIRAGIAIVHIKSGVLEPILIGVLLQDKFLVLDTVGVALQIIISGQTAIERRDLLVWL